MKSTRQGSNDDELLLYPRSRYTGCKAKRQKVQWDPQRAQLHPLHPPDYGPAPDIDVTDAQYVSSFLPARAVTSSLFG